MGFVPERSKEGNLIVLMPGGSVPYALRSLPDPNYDEVEDSDKSRPSRYRFIGDAYIHSIMTGEAWDESKLEKILLA